MALSQEIDSPPANSLSLSFPADRPAAGFAFRLFVVLMLALVASVVFLPSAVFEPTDAVMLRGPYAAN
jgi:hypothetical protein